ncbi:hypothetical protein Tco_0529244 [Tanacetum coccineum]
MTQAKGLKIQEPSEFKTTSSSLQASQLPQAKDKGKGIMVVPEVPIKKKDQVSLIEEMARNLKAQLQAELIEEERLARQKEEEANIPLLESWDNTQAMMDADFQLAQQMQTEEQEQLSIEEKSNFFVELLEKRKKHFAALRAQEKRIKPPAKAQNRNQMSTYLKNMARYKHGQLKSKSYDEIHEMFDKEMKRVNTFVDMNSELVKGSKTKAEEEAEMKRHIEIVKDNEKEAQKVFINDKDAINGIDRKDMETPLEIWYDEDIHDLRSIETEFPSIVFNDALTSKVALSCEPTTSEPTQLIYEFDYFKDFEKELPAIAYNDALTSKLDFSKPTVSPQHIDEFDETSMSESDDVIPRKFQIMAASANVISSDSSDKSVGSPPSRVIYFGDIPIVIPSTSVVAPETSAIAPVISSTASVVETTLIASPTGLCGLVPYSDSDSDSPDKMSSPEHISLLPAISLFLCTDSSKAPDSSDGPPS